MPSSQKSPFPPMPQTAQWAKMEPLKSRAAQRRPEDASARSALTRFSNPAGLEHLGGNNFRETAASGSPTEGTPTQAGFGSLSQGLLEMSNVQIVQEMVNMITAQRAYEVNSKAIQTSDEMLQTANGLKR